MDFITTQEAAKIIGVSPRGVLHLIDAGTLKARKCECGRTRLIRRKDAEWARDHKPGVGYPAGRPRK